MVEIRPRSRRAAAVAGILLLSIGTAGCEESTPTDFATKLTCEGYFSSQTMTGTATVTPATVTDGGTVWLKLRNVGPVEPIAPSIGPLYGTTWRLPVPPEVEQIVDVTAGGSRFRWSIADMGWLTLEWGGGPADSVSAFQSEIVVTAKLRSGIGPTSVAWGAFPRTWWGVKSAGSGAPYSTGCMADPGNPPLVTFPVGSPAV